MNEKNFDYLKDQLKYNGFGEGLEKELKEKISQKPEHFKLEHETEYNGQKVSAVLDFNKSKESDLYFFNRYRASVVPENAKESLSQDFYIQNKGQSITLKEAFNLMNGRAVHKELTNKDQEVYQAWVKLDFKEMDERGNFKQRKMNNNYGFNLEESVSKLPLMEVINAAEKEKLIQSLQKGNRQAVTFNLDGAMEKRYIEANPTAHGLNVYDSQQRFIPEKQEQKQEVKERQEIAETQKESKQQKQRQHM